MPLAPRLAIERPNGGAALREVANHGGHPLRLRPTLDPRSPGIPSPVARTSYAPLSFLVGADTIEQYEGGLWGGNLKSGTAQGTWYSARRVLSARRDGRGVRLVVSSDDPDGRRLIVTVAPEAGDAIQVDARPTPSTGVAEVSDAFQSSAGEGSSVSAGVTTASTSMDRCSTAGPRRRTSTFSRSRTGSTPTGPRRPTTRSRSSSLLVPMASCSISISSRASPSTSAAGAVGTSPPPPPPWTTRSPWARRRSRSGPSPPSAAASPLPPDVGGYFDLTTPPTTRQLFLRWAEWAALSPVFRLHGSGLNGAHTPWSFGPETVRTYDQISRLHLRAAPLIERLWRQADATGMPITRPLWLQFPGDRASWRQDEEWMLGPDVLVAPVVRKGAVSRSVYFPTGCWRAPSGAARRGPGTARVPAPLTVLPYFTRCGSTPFQHHSQTAPKRSRPRPDDDRR